MTRMSWRPVHSVGFVFLVVLGGSGVATAQDELLSAPPEERSTPESRTCST